MSFSNIKKAFLLICFIFIFLNSLFSLEGERFSYSEDYLLMLVNKENSLPKIFVPFDLVDVESRVDGVGNSETKKLSLVAAVAFEKLVLSAKKEGHLIKMRTGYRSYNYQKNLFDSYATRYGEEAANTFSARAGQSEHQSGLALDVSSPSVNYMLSYDYGDTKEGKWLSLNAYKFGFIIRYIDGTKDEIGKITKYLYEPWHIRYVGENAAKTIFEEKLTLEEYLLRYKK